MIRPSRPSDTPALLKIAEGTGVFRPRELESLADMLDDLHAGRGPHHQKFLVFESDGQPAGFIQFMPADVADRAWYVWWIAVDKTRHNKGIGGQLLRHAEDDIRAAGGRLIFIETSGKPIFEATRAFYIRNGYPAVATVPDFYTDNDDLVIFQKRLTPKS